MGIKITCNLDYEAVRTHTNGCIVAANHISVFDHFPALAMPLSTLMVHHVDSIAGKVMGFLLFKGSGTSYWEVNNLKQMVKKFRDWKKSPDGVALYVTPEATINNRRGFFVSALIFGQGTSGCSTRYFYQITFWYGAQSDRLVWTDKISSPAHQPNDSFQYGLSAATTGVRLESESGSPEKYADRVQQKLPTIWPFRQLG